LIAVALVALLVVAIVGTFALIRLSAHGPGPLTVAQVEVVWRDRNVEVVVYLSGAAPAPPEVTLQSTLGLAFAQEALVGADLANYQ
jgi:hypothetical protein